MFELVTTSLFVFSSLYGGPATDTAAVATTAPATVEMVEATSSISPNAGVKDAAIAYFKDTPVLADIAFCESSFRQYDKNGKVLVGKVNKSDIGVMQINTYYQGKKAKELGYDLTTVDGNMAYAKYLYETEGTTPWASSESCWKDGMNGTPVNGMAMR